MATKSVTKPKAVTDENKLYAYEGVDQRGKIIKGEIRVRNESTAKANIRKLGLEPKKVVLKKTKRGGKSISPKDIAIMSRQLATMMQSGVPLVQSLEIMSDGSKNPRMANLLATIKNDISAGATLHDALARHPLYFDELYINLVKAGEGAGVLEQILDTISGYKERTESLKGKIKKALYYPIAVIVIAMLVSCVLLIWVVPQFEAMFKGFGADLPAFTQMIVSASRFMLSYWWALLIGFGGGGWALINIYKRSIKLQHLMDRILLKTPVISKILHGAAIARFARTLAITFKAGVPLVEAMGIVSGATGSETYKKAVLEMRDDVSVGYAVNVSMKQTNLFPHVVVQMAAIGEEAGALDTMLEKVAENYEEEVSNAVDSLSSLLEPFIILILGVVVGGMVIGMYLPIFKMAETI